MTSMRKLGAAGVMAAALTFAVACQEPQVEQQDNDTELGAQQRDLGEFHAVPAPAEEAVLPDATGGAGQEGDDTDKAVNPHTMGGVRNPENEIDIAEPPFDEQE